MKLSTQSKAILALAVLLGVILLNSGLNAAPLKEFTKKFKNGKTYIQSSKIPKVRNGFKVTTYYDNDKIMRIEEWKDGKRNGITKVFNKDGSILKDIEFVENYVKEYKSYKNGRVETQISSDRRTIINKGRRITANWDKYYEIWNGNRIVYFDKIALVDFMLNYVIPEEATEVFANINDFFQAAPGANMDGKNDILNCSGGAKVFNDNNVDLMSVANSNQRSSTGLRNQGSKKGELPSSTVARNTVTNMLNICASNIAESSSVRGGVGNSNQNRNSDINKANSTLDAMISGCQSQRGNNGLIAVEAIPRAVVLKYIAEMEAAEALANAKTVVHAVTQISGEAGTVMVERSAVGSAITTIAEGGAAAVEGTALRTAAGTALRGFVLGGLATTAAGVTTAAVLGWQAGSMFNETQVGKAFTEYLAGEQEAGDAEFQEASRLAEQAHREAERRAIERAQSTGSNTGSQGSNTPDASTPDPDAMGNGDACQRMETFKSYCNSVSWRDYKCEEFMRFAKNCKGDIREIYVSPEGGSVMNFGCKPGGDPAVIREADCKRKGLLRIPGGNSSTGICASASIQPSDILLGPNPNVTDPPRGDFDIAAVKGLNVSFANDKDAPNLLKTKKPTFVIFSDPDCVYCNNLSQTISKSKNILSTLADFDIVIIDVNMNPILAQQYGVNIIPSYFIANSSKRTDLQAGALNEKNLLNYLNDNKNVSNTKK